jgi:hypothetical protein
MGTNWMSGELVSFGGAGQGNGYDSYGPDVFLYGTNHQVGQNLSIAATFATRWTLARGIAFEAGTRMQIRPKSFTLATRP